jgi:hypothetical protein
LIIGLTLPITPPKFILIPQLLFALILTWFLMRQRIKMEIWGVLILLLVAPGLLNSTILFGELDPLRYFPLITLLAISMMKMGVGSIKLGAIEKVIKVVMFYMFAMQIAVGFGAQSITDIRDYLYPIEKNYWNYDLSALRELDFSYRDVRLAGLYYNPNTQALYYVIYLMIILLIRTVRTGAFNNVYIFFILIGILLTGSRTALASATIALFFSYGRGWMAKFMILAMIGISYESLWDSVALKSESGQTKLGLILDYISTSTLDMLVFGSGTYRQMDSEYGNWLLMGGVLATFGLLVFYIRLYLLYNNRKGIILGLITMGVGATVTTNLSIFCLLVVLMILLQIHKRDA